MNIQLNGKEHALSSECSVAELLNQLGLKGKPVVVELNSEALLSADFEKTTVTADSKIEIISITAGG